MSEHGEADDPTGSETGVALTASDVSVRSGLEPGDEQPPADEAGSTHDANDDVQGGLLTTTPLLLAFITPVTANI